MAGIICLLEKTVTKLHDKEYWSSQFDITLVDMNRIAMRLERTGTPQDLKSIALPLIIGRLEHGHDPGLAALREPHGIPIIRWWDPASEWETCNTVLVVHDRYGNSKYEPLLGEIIYIDQELAEIKIEELKSTKNYVRTLPGTKNARKYRSAGETWRNIILDAAKKKLQSKDPEEQAEGILLEHGEHILTRLAISLQMDTRFICLDGRWYLILELPRIESSSLHAIHHFLLQNLAASVDDLLPVLTESSTTDASLLKMAIHTTLHHFPDRFENIGTSARPRWKARVPELEQAEVTHFAYDSQSYEILCRPGQRLSQKKARRLQELELYAHVVTFTE